MYEKQRVLVTGGAGFLGGHLVRKLAQEAEHVYVLDDLFTGRRSTVPNAENVAFIQGSVTDASLVREIVSQVDTVFHFAARNISLSVIQPESDFGVNAAGTMHVLLAAREYQTRIKRVVYASTSSIYGSTKQLPAREGDYNVSVPYAASKFSGELLAIAYAKMFCLPVTCLRFSNVYGPGQDSANPYCGVVAKFLEAVLRKNPLVIYGDGTQTRDFTYVEDAIEATLSASLAESTLGEVFNVGTGIETTVNELKQLVLETVQKPDHPVEFAERRKIDTVHRRSVDASKLQSTIAWQPKYSLQEGLAKTWKWVQSQEKEGMKNESYS